MKKIFLIGFGLMGLFIALLIAAVVGFFVLFERAEKPLSVSEVEERLKQTGFTIEPQSKLLLYADQEEMLPEKPGLIQTLRLTHSGGDSFSVTAASFSNEKAAQYLSGKTNGFVGRNWFFFGTVNNAMVKQIQEALKAGENEMVFRRKIPEVEHKVTSETESGDSSRLTGSVPKVPDEILSRQELLSRFQAAGLTINRIEEDKGMPSSVRRKMPPSVEALDDFLLFIEEEGVFPVEFKSPGDAIRMQQNHKKGFRYGNWYFPGQISVDLKKKLISALERK